VRDGEASLDEVGLHRSFRNRDIMIVDLALQILRTNRILRI